MTDPVQNTQQSGTPARHAAEFNLMVAFPDKMEEPKTNFLVRPKISLPDPHKIAREIARKSTPLGNPKPAKFNINSLDKNSFYKAVIDVGKRAGSNELKDNMVLHCSAGLSIKAFAEVAAGRATKVLLRQVGEFCTYLAIGLGALDVSSAMVQDFHETGKLGANTGITVKRQAGLWAGMLEGGEVGGLFGPEGVFIGGLVGGAIGSGLPDQIMHYASFSPPLSQEEGEAERKLMDSAARSFPGRQ